MFSFLLLSGQLASIASLYSLHTSAQWKTETNPVLGCVRLEVRADGYVSATVTDRYRAVRITFEGIDAISCTAQIEQWAALIPLSLFLAGAKEVKARHIRGQVAATLDIHLTTTGGEATLSVGGRAFSEDLVNGFFPKVDDLFQPALPEHGLPGTWIGINPAFLTTVEKLVAPCDERNGRKENLHWKLQFIPGMVNLNYGQLLFTRDNVAYLVQSNGERPC